MKQLKPDALTQQERSLQFGHPLMWYLILSYGIAWGLWIMGGSILPDSASATKTALGMFAPLAAVLVAVKFIGGQPTGIGWKPQFKGHIKVYLLALFGPALVTLAGGLVYFLVFRSQFDPELSGLAKLFTPEQLAALGGAEALPGLFGAQVAAGVLAGGLVNLPYALGEEAGWRGYLYPELTRHMSRGKALVLGGVIWGLWHLPLTVSGHNYGTGYPGWPWLGVAAMCGFCICAGICLAWLTQRSGSIWPAALCHGAINAIGVAPSMLLSAQAAPNPLLGPSPMGVLAGLPLVVLAVLAARSLCREH